MRGVNPAGQIWVIDKLEARVRTNLLNGVAEECNGKRLRIAPVAIVAHAQNLSPMGLNGCDRAQTALARSRARLTVQVMDLSRLSPRRLKLTFNFIQLRFG